MAFFCRKLAADRFIASLRRCIVFLVGLALLLGQAQAGQTIPPSCTITVIGDVVAGDINRFAVQFAGDFVGSNFNLVGPRLGNPLPTPDPVTGLSTYVTDMYFIVDYGPVTLSVTDSTNATVCQASFTALESDPTLTIPVKTVAVGQPAQIVVNNFVFGMYFCGDGPGGNSLYTGTSGYTCIYFNPGTYTVRVQSNSSPRQATGSITVVSDTLGLSLGSNAIFAGEGVVATLSNLVPGASYLLDWGDGTTTTLVAGDTTVMRDHTYNTARAMPYMVQLSDPTLAQFPSAPQPVTVSPAPVILPQLAVSPNPAQVGEVVSVIVSKRPGAYILNWGDGNSSPVSLSADATVVTHTYALGGTYTLTLTGAPSPVTANLVVNAPIPIPPLTLNVTPNPALTTQTVTANMTGLQSGTAYTIDWGDNSSGPATMNTHVYSGAGTYTVTLSGGTQAPVTTVVTVNAPIPIPPLTLNVTPNPALTTQTVTANMTGLQSGTAYTIDWGDNSSGPATVNTHLYSGPGTYTVTLSGGTQTPVATVVTITAPIVIPPLTLNVTPNPALTTQTVTANMTGLQSGTAYTIDWGDGTNGPATVNKHVYSGAGTYTVTLSGGTQAPVTTVVTITAPIPPLTLNVTPNPALTTQTVTANMTGLQSGTAYTIDWGDGTNGPATVNTHVYSGAGTYTVTLSGGMQAPVTTVVTITAPIPPLTLNVTPNPALTTQTVTANMTGLQSGTAYTIDWGDNSSGPATVNTHLYSGPGTYTVTLSGGTQAPVTTTVTITAPIPPLTLNVTPNPALTTQTVTANMTGLQSGTAYTIDWGDGSNGPATVNTHFYSGEGIYTVTLSGGTQAPVSAVIMVTAPIPPLALVATPNPALVGQTVTANITGLQLGTAYMLDWGDGKTSPIPGSPATHAYSDAGTYTITLSGEMQNTVTTTVTITAPIPRLTLNVAPNPALTTQTVTANMTGLQSGTAYTIDWGDGKTGPASVNTHLYSAAGTYTVTLSGGTQAPATAVVTVTAPIPIPPLALNVAPNPVLAGQTATASLSNLQAGVRYTLDWGDNKSSEVTGNEMTHVYALPGSYVVQLSGGEQAPVTVVLTVTAPQLLVTVLPNPALVGQEVTASLTNLLGGLTYTLDWGDGSQPETIEGSGLAAASLMHSLANAQRTHTYTQPGTFTVSLSTAGQPVATALVTINPTLTVLGTRLHFIVPEDSAAPRVVKNEQVAAVLDIEYVGQGIIEGDLLLDGRVIEHLRLLAPASENHLRHQSANLPTQLEGSHTLEFVPVAALSAQSGALPQAVAYLVDGTAKVWPSEVGKVQSVGFTLNVGLKIEQGSGSGTVMQVPQGLRVTYFFGGGNIKLRVDVPGSEFVDLQARVVTYDTQKQQARVLLLSTMQPDPELSPAEQAEMGQSFAALTGDLLRLLDPDRPFYKQTADQFIAKMEQMGFRVLPRSTASGQLVAERITTTGDTSETLRLTFDESVGAVTGSMLETVGPQQTVRSTSAVTYLSARSAAGEELVIPASVQSRTSSTLTGSAAVLPLQLPTADLQLPPGSTEPQLQPGDFVAQTFTSPNGQGVVDINTTTVSSDVVYEQIDINNPTVTFPEVK